MSPSPPSPPTPLLADRASNALAPSLPPSAEPENSTDFRQFATYGNLTGLDMALVQNSYLYHTRLDLPQFIEPGAMQHMGENTLALLRYLTSNETSLGKGEEGKQGLALVKRGEMVYFSGLGGWLFLVYTRQEATRIYTLLATLAVVFVTARVDWNRKGVHLAGVASVGGSFVAALLGANVAAVVTSKVMGKSMTWCVFSLPLSLSLFRDRKELTRPRRARATGSDMKPSPSSSTVLQRSSRSSSFNCGSPRAFAPLLPSTNKQNLPS